MSTERIEQWLRAQQQLVEADGTAASHVQLIGPDDQPWGTWPTSDANLRQSVLGALQMCGEELAYGPHRARLVAITSDGHQLSSLPTRIHGRSNVAATAGSEAKELQRAVSLMVTNVETLTTAVRNQCEQLSAQNEQLQLANIELSQALSQLLARNLQYEADREEKQIRNEGLSRMFAQAEPAIGALAQLISDQAEAALAKKKAAAREPSNGQSADRAVCSGAIEPAQPGPDGAASDPGGNGAGARKRKRGDAPSGGTDPEPKRKRGPRSRQS